MDKTCYLSQKVRCISFFALLCVFAIHSGAGEVHTIVNRYITSWAVPWFLIVSGYFFESSFKKYSQKEFWRKKIHSLVIPYLSWGIFGFLVLNEGRWSSDIDQVLGIIATYPQYNQPLWFIRSLLLYMGIMSILYSALSERFHWLAKIMFVAITSLMVYCNYQILMPSSPYYFFLGCVMSGRILQRGSVSRKYCAGGLFVLVLALLGVLWLRIGQLSLIPTVMVKNVYNLLVIPLIWTLYDCLDVRHVLVVDRLTPLTMFCYACHCPIYTFCVNRWYGNSLCAEWKNCGFIVVFIFAGLLVFLIACMTRRYMSRIYGVLSGGR